MRVLVIGGTGFIGPFLVRQLSSQGHSVSVFHRGKSQLDLPAEHILGDWRDLRKLGLKADVVVDLILASGAQARERMTVFRQRARRIVAASSADVYRACGVLHHLEDGPPDPVPLTEESPLRSKPQTYPREQVELIKKMVPWWDDFYDKIAVERAIMGDPELPGTILRLPMIYGPGDYARRFHPVLKRIDDSRHVILYDQGWAAWRAPGMWKTLRGLSLSRLPTTGPPVESITSRNRRRTRSSTGHAKSLPPPTGPAIFWSFQATAFRDT